MSVRKLKPITPGQRFRIVNNFEEITTNKPEKSLTVGIKKSGGRNQTGKMTMRYTGGGHKKKYRIIDFKRNKANVEATVKSVEYDPNRSANIALLLYADGERRYIVASKDLVAGSVVQSGPDAPVAVGNCLPMTRIPVGTIIHCIEMKPGKGAQLARSAGCSVQLLAREGRHATLRLKSGEMRKVLADCRAVVGEVGKSQHNLQKIGKAGRSRWLNIRPRVRGVAMNPVDHPHGGGEGRSAAAGGPRTPWGVREGKKTRNKRAPSSKLIIRRRKNKSEK